MGTVELALLLKFGVPLAVKLLANGKDEEETSVVVGDAIEKMAANKDVGPVLRTADKAQTESIINGMFSVIVGTGDAIGCLLKAILGLLGGR